MTKEAFYDKYAEIIGLYYNDLMKIEDKWISKFACRALLNHTTALWMQKQYQTQGDKCVTLCGVPVLYDETIEDGEIKLFVDASKIHFRYVTKTEDKRQEQHSSVGCPLRHTCRIPELCTEKCRELHTQELKEKTYEKSENNA